MQIETNVVDVKALCWKRRLVILGVALFTLANYLCFGPSKSNVQHAKNSVAKPRSPSIAGFYHFATVSGPWRSIVDEQMLLAHVSGLIAASSNVYVTGLGDINANKTIYDTFADSKFIYEYDTKREVYEFPTLKKLEKFCLHNNESLVWYAHSKGASHQFDDVATWRGVLNHFVLGKWRLCHGLLSSTNYTTCSSLLVFDSMRQVGWNTYYAGNMWWAKCSHVNRLTRIEKLDQKDRYIAELYVTSEPDIGHFNCFSGSQNYGMNLNKQNDNCTVNQPIWKVR